MARPAVRRYKPEGSPPQLITLFAICTPPAARHHPETAGSKRHGIPPCARTACDTRRAEAAAGGASACVPQVHRPQRGSRAGHRRVCPALLRWPVAQSSRGRGCRQGGWLHGHRAELLPARRTAAVCNAPRALERRVSCGRCGAHKHPTCTRLHRSWRPAGSQSASQWQRCSSSAAPTTTSRSRYAGRCRWAASSQLWSMCRMWPQQATPSCHPGGW